MGLPSEVIIQETVRVLSKKELPMEWRFCNLSELISKHFSGKSVHYSKKNFAKYQ